MKKIGLFLITGLVVLLSSSMVLVNAQVPWVEWSQTYGGINNDGEFHLVYLIKVSDGGYIIASNTESFGAGGNDAWLIKVDSSGNIEWNQTYGGEKEDRALSLILTTDGGYALAGRTSSFGAGSNHNFWLVKTDEQGNMQWNQTYGGTNRAEALSVVQTSDGRYALAGEIWIDDGDQDFWLVKTDEYGNIQWNRTYGGSSQETPFSLVETSDTGFVLAGRTRSFGIGDGDCWLVKVDSLGNMEWNKTYGGEETDHIESIVQTSDGGFALGATTESFSPSWAIKTECWLIKTDNLGNMVWDKTYGGAENDWIHSLIITSDGGFAFVGETDSFGAGSRDFYLVKTDSDGNIEWSRTYGGTDLDFGQSLVETLDGGFVLAGNTKSFGVGGYDVWLIKTDSLGIPEFPSWIILPLFLTATLIVTLARKKLRR